MNIQIVFDLPFMEEFIYIITDDDIFIALIYEGYAPYIKTYIGDKKIENSKYLMVTKAGEFRFVSSSSNSEGILIEPEKLSHILFLFVSSNILLKKDAYFMHGAVISQNGKGIILTGESGAGKSTCCSFLQLAKDNINCVTDDKVIVDCENLQLYPCGDGIHLREDSIKILNNYFENINEEYIELYNYRRVKIKLDMNKSLKLLAVVQIDRNDKVNGIEELSSSKAMKALLMNGFVTSNIGSNIECAVNLCRKINVFKMHYNDLTIMKEMISNLLERGDSSERG